MNVNENCWVKLTAAGEKRIEQYYRQFEHLGPEHAWERVKKYHEENGWVRFQLYDLMHIFGPDLYMGSNNLPFKNNEVRLSKP